jgi:hypothetical protein
VLKTKENIMKLWNWNFYPAASLGDIATYCNDRDIEDIVWVSEGKVTSILVRVTDAKYKELVREA